MKTKMAAVAWLTAAGAVPALAAGAPGAENSACEFQSPGGDFIQFSCPLLASSSMQRWRFKVDFAGGHEDTSASMTLTLNEAPLDCDAGSKTRLFGEDGDVSLVCRFRVPEPTGTSLLLRVTLQWGHAQYVRSELSVEKAGC